VLRPKYGGLLVFGNISPKKKKPNTGGGSSKYRRKRTPREKAARRALKNKRLHALTGRARKGKPKKILLKNLKKGRRGGS